MQSFTPPKTKLLISWRARAVHYQKLLDRCEDNGDDKGAERNLLLSDAWELAASELAHAQI